MCYQSVWNYVVRESVELFEWAKCGDSGLSAVPTALWTVGVAALAHRLVGALFRRFMFRRVPLWEILVQQLLFVWMVIYCLHFWVLLVKIVKVVVEFCYENEDTTFISIEVGESQKVMQQWIIWMCGVIPLVTYFYTRPRAPTPPLMIWITTNPWQRREMGPYGYYLNRPFSNQPSSTNIMCLQNQALALRRAFSDSKAMVKEQPKKRRNSKSV